MRIGNIKGTGVYSLEHVHTSNAGTWAGKGDGGLRAVGSRLFGERLNIGGTSKRRARVHERVTKVIVSVRVMMNQTKAGIVDMV